MINLIFSSDCRREILKNTPLSTIVMDYAQLIDGFGLQLKDALSFSREIRLSQKPNAVVVCGMGSSGSVGDIIANLDCSVPVVVNKSEELPVCVDRNTLVFCISYSGMSQEIIQCAQSALKKHAKLVIVTSGGKLLKLAQENNVTTFKVPAGQFVHWVLGYLLVPVVCMLANNGLTSTTMDDIKNTIPALSLAVKQKALELAENIGQKIPFICAPHQLFSAACHAKESINRIAKMPAYAGAFPEITHADAAAVNKSVHAIIFRDQNESVVVRGSIESFKNVAKQHKLPFTELMLRGERLFNKIMIAVLFGEYLAYFLAQRAGVGVEI